MSYLRNLLARTFEPTAGLRPLRTSLVASVAGAEQGLYDETAASNSADRWENAPRGMSNDVASATNGRDSTAERDEGEEPRSDKAETDELALGRAADPPRQALTRNGSRTTSVAAAPSATDQEPAAHTGGATSPERETRTERAEPTEGAPQIQHGIRAGRPTPAQRIKAAHEQAEEQTEEQTDEETERATKDAGLARQRISAKLAQPEAPGAPEQSVIAAPSDGLIGQHWKASRSIGSMERRQSAAEQPSANAIDLSAAGSRAVSRRDARTEITVGMPGPPLADTTPASIREAVGKRQAGEAARPLSAADGPQAPGARAASTEPVPMVSQTLEARSMHGMEPSSVWPRNAGTSGRRQPTPEPRVEREETTVHITIGRLEVRGTAPVQAQRQPRMPSSAPTLEDYLKARNREQRRE